MKNQDKRFKDLVIISQAFHHLEKSILLRKKIFYNAKIINLQKNRKKLIHFKNNFKQEFVEHFESFEKINFQDFKYFNSFIFFSFSPTLPIIQFVKEIKQSGKKIILIQDNHQFSVHHGAVNSIIFKPDLIISASDSEKAYINTKMPFDEISVISNGWLFSNNNYLEDKKFISKKKRVLIAFSAPSEITLVSMENYESRLKIMSWINEKYPEYNLIVKLHPHENVDRFNAFFKNYDLIFTLLPSQSSISEAVSESDIVVSSNESQIPLDVISTDINKKIILYFYQKENFLIEDIELYSTEADYHLLNIKIGDLKLPARKKIRDYHLRQNEDTFKKTASYISKLNINNINFDSMIDIYLWLYIYGHKSYIIKFLKSHHSSKHSNLLNLINNKEVDTHKLDQDFLNQSTRDPLCIILIRHFLYLQKINKKDLKYITERFFKDYLFQFFFRDLIRFNNLILAKNLSASSEGNYLYLVNNVELLYVSKLRFFKIFFKLLKKVYSLKIISFSLLFFKISDRVFKI